MNESKFYNLVLRSILQVVRIILLLLNNLVLFAKFQHSVLFDEGKIVLLMYIAT